MPIRPELRHSGSRCVPCSRIVIGEVVAAAEFLRGHTVRWQAILNENGGFVLDLVWHVGEYRLQNRHTTRLAAGKLCSTD